MKLMINLPKEVVTAIQNGEDYRYDIHTAIAQGILYEERPRGDLISREALKKYARVVFDKDLGRLIVVDVSDIDNAPSIDAIPNEEGYEMYGKGYCKGHLQGYEKGKNERPQGKWGKWVISEIRCPECLEYYDPDCYSKEELNKCPNCGADMRKGGEE